MSLGLRCPACQKKMSVPDHALGRRVQCPRCEATFRYTGQKELTLGRVRARPALAVAAPMLARPGNMAIDEDMQTMPVIDLPEMPQALLEQFKRPTAEEPELIVDAEDAFDLEMFHATPVETVLPEVSEAEIEALFLEGEPSIDISTRPEMRSLDSTLPIAAVPQPPPADPLAIEEVEEIVDAEPYQLDDDIVDAEAAVDEAAVDEAVVDVVEEIEEIADVEEFVEEGLVEVARIDPGETLPWRGGTPGAAPVDVAPVDEKADIATKPELDLGAHAAEDHVEEFIEELVEEFDDEAPIAAPLAAAPLAMASPVKPGSMPIAAAMPAGSVPMAGVLRAHVVPGQVVQGSIVPMAAPAAPLMETLPYVPRSAPISDAPIPPPTPPAKAPIADDDLDAMFREVMGDAEIAMDDSPVVEAVDEHEHSIEAFAPEPVADVIEEIHELEPAVAEIGDAAVEEDLDLMAFFADDAAPAAPAAGEPEGEPIEVVEEIGFTFEDDSPAKK